MTGRTEVSGREISAELDLAQRRRVLAAGPPPIPVPADPWALRLIRPGSADARLVVEWMRRPHVERFWQQAWSAAQWDDVLAGQVGGDFSRPVLVLRDGVPFGYVELYRAARDVVARHYRAEPGDIGLHIAIADPGQTDRGLGRQFVAALIAALRVDGACRVLVDPDERHQQARRWAVGAGFRPLITCDLGHKRAALLIHDQDQ